MVSAFGNEKNIIITDIEQIKDEHRESYNLLKAQNVKNLVVCPIRYKDEIKAFSVWIIHRKVILSD